jgi:lactate 2-monooxygenase
VSEGFDGVMVSNHGGRQVDGGVGALDALPRIVAAVKGRAPVLFDSGVRCGADIFKALALGATAVGIGRPYVYGLAMNGEAGVCSVLEHLVAELDLTMALTGCRTGRDIKPDALFNA